MLLLKETHIQKKTNTKKKITGSLNMVPNNMIFTGGHRCKVQSLLESVPFRGLYFSDLAECTLQRTNYQKIPKFHRVYLIEGYFPKIFQINKNAFTGQYNLLNPKNCTSGLQDRFFSSIFMTEKGQMLKRSWSTFTSSDARS